jgi:hypothetical protein
MKEIFILEMRRQKQLKLTWLILGIIILDGLWMYISDFFWGIPRYNPVQNAYIHWFGCCSWNVQTYWFYFVFSLIVVVPVVFTYGRDLKCGYYNQLIIKAGRKEYIKGKGLQVFGVGFLMVVVSLLFLFMLSFLIYPAVVPDPCGGFGPDTQSYFCGFYYEHPFIYNIIYILVDGFFAGAIALWACALVNLYKNAFEAAVTPFIVTYVVYTVSNLKGDYSLSAHYFLCPGSGFCNVFSVCIYVFVILSSVIAWKVTSLKHD